MKKIVALLSSLSLLLGTSSALAAPGYPKPDPQGLDNLFLVYTGYSVNSDGTTEEQHWETKDFQPLVTHINRSTNHADDQMFTDFLFMGVAIKNPYGQMKYIAQAGDAPGDGPNNHKFREHDSQWAYPADWHVYLDQLFGGNNPSYMPQNIDALYNASIHNGLNHALNENVWIALPYPDPKVFTTDQQRIATLEDWIDTFILTWKSKGYTSNFQLKGFYWIGESVDHTDTLNDVNVIKAINQYIHNKAVNGESYRTVWIPYEGANGWDQWKNLGFDMSFLQPNYYFETYKTLEKGAHDAYTTNQGVEMEMDLGVTWDTKPGGYRSRFFSYLNTGVTGDHASYKPAYTPYMPPASALAWYTGGWWWNGNQRDQSMLRLYRSGDKLYDMIYDFLQGKYKPVITPDTSKQDSSKQDTSKPNSNKQDSSKPDSSK